VKFTRDGVVRMARLHHFLSAISGLYYPNVTPGGALGKGEYFYDNGSGDRFVIGWTKDAFVALAFAHESDRSEFDEDEDDRRPLVHLKKLPPRLVPFAKKLAAGVENLATAGMWGIGEKATLSDRVTSKTPWAHGLEMLAGFGCTPEETLDGWLELMSLAPAHGALALRLADGTKRIGAADERVLFTLPNEVETITLEAARTTQGSFAQGGVAWRVPRARLEAMAKERACAQQERVANAVAPDDRALFEAARANRTDEIAALVARGANVDARTVQGQWAHTPAGDTPLIQACKKGGREAALALLRAGANPSLVNSFGQSGLLWAARERMGDVVEACLAAGADPNLADTHGETPILHAAQGGDLAMVERLLAVGAKADAKMYNGVTPADRASFHGHFAIARLLRERS
jgi:hypothetical protein